MPEKLVRLRTDILTAGICKTFLLQHRYFWHNTTIPLQLKSSDRWHAKNNYCMVVLTTEWLQSRCGDSGYELILVPEGCISNLSPNHTLQLHEHLWESHYNHTSKRWCFWQKLVTLSQMSSGQSARSWLLLHTIRCNHFTYMLIQWLLTARCRL